MVTILSQDKSLLVNADQIDLIGIKLCDSVLNAYRIYADIGTVNVLLGMYIGKTRATDILYDIATTIDLGGPRYIMPEK